VEDIFGFIPGYYSSNLRADIQKVFIKTEGLAGTRLAYFIPIIMITLMMLGGFIGH
jgi:hypothetical protein